MVRWRPDDVTIEHRIIVIVSSLHRHRPIASLSYHRSAHPFILLSSHLHCLCDIILPSLSDIIALSRHRHRIIVSSLHPPKPRCNGAIVSYICPYPDSILPLLCSKNNCGYSLKHLLVSRGRKSWIKVMYFSEHLRTTKLFLILKK